MPFDPFREAALLLLQSDAAGVAEARCMQRIMVAIAPGESVQWEAVLDAIAAMRDRNWTHPIQPIDIWRTAGTLLANYKEAAPEYASRRITELTNAGDQTGAAVWADVMGAIAEIRRQAPRTGELLH